MDLDSDSTASVEPLVDLKPHSGLHQQMVGYQLLRKVLFTTVYSSSNEKDKCFLRVVF